MEILIHSIHSHYESANELVKELRGELAATQDTIAVLSSCGLTESPFGYGYIVWMAKDAYLARYGSSPKYDLSKFWNRNAI